MDFLPTQEMKEGAGGFRTEGSTPDLLYRTMKDEFGGGDARKQLAGDTNEVQDNQSHRQSIRAGTCDEVGR